MSVTSVTLATSGGPHDNPHQKGAACMSPQPFFGLWPRGMVKIMGSQHWAVHRITIMIVLL